MTPRQAMEGIAVAMAGYGRGRGVRWEPRAADMNKKESA